MEKKESKTKEYIDIWGNTVVHQRESVESEWYKQKKLYDGWLVNLTPLQRFFIKLRKFLSNLSESK